MDENGSRRTSRARSALRSTRRHHRSQNSRQVKAIADSVEEALRTTGVRPAHVEGYDRADWVLMDFFTFIVHVFAPHTRDFYSLERLWGDAERIEIGDESPAR